MALERFSDNPQAKALHQQGVHAFYRGEYDAAQGNFDEALTYLASPEGRGPSPIERDSRQLQRASIIRFSALVCMVQGLHGKLKPSLSYEYAEDRLLRAQSVTERLLARHQADYSPDAWAQLNAEHGGTLSMLARLATVNTVAQWRLSRLSLINPMVHYERADDFLEQGSNRHLYASNAINAAVYLRYDPEAQLQTAQGVEHQPFMQWALKALNIVEVAEQERHTKPLEYDFAQLSVSHRIGGIVSRRAAEDVILHRLHTPYNPVPEIASE